jgi:hypothetical protein
MGQPSMVHERTGESERVGEQSEHPLRGVFAMFARTPRTLRTLFVLFAMFATAYPSGLIPRTVNFGKSNRIGSEWRTGTDGVSRQGKTRPTEGE